MPARPARRARPLGSPARSRTDPRVGVSWRPPFPCRHFHRAPRYPAGVWGWRLGATYIVVEQSSALAAAEHDRRRPGLNHLAFHVESTELVDALTAQAAEHGWTLMFADRHPHAGGNDHYAAYLEDPDGFEVELVATAGAATSRERPAGA